jgi:hypothetical protein
MPALREGALSTHFLDATQGNILSNSGPSVQQGFKFAGVSWRRPCSPVLPPFDGLSKSVLKDVLARGSYRHLAALPEWTDPEKAHLCSDLSRSRAQILIADAVNLVNQVVDFAVGRSDVAFQAVESCAGR